MNLNIVAITRVLDEADVIEALVRHTAAYVSHHIFLDNGSADGTLEILSALKQEGIPLTVFQSHAVTFNEADGLTFMYNFANRTYAPDWVLCIDADEFIDDRGLGIGLPPYLEHLTSMQSPIECIHIPMVSYIATSQDRQEEPNVALRVTRRVLTPIEHQSFKIILKGGLPEGYIKVHDGSHTASLNSRDIQIIHTQDICLAHYSERSAFQYITKFVRGWNKVVATGQSSVDEMVAYHYKDAYHYLLEDPKALLRNKGFMGFKNEWQDNVHDPIEYQGGALKYTPELDEPMRAVRALMGILNNLAKSHGRILDEIPGVRTTVRAWEDQVIPYI